MNVELVKQITTTASRAFFKGTLYARKYAPEILTCLGIGCGGASVVTACKATLKVKDIADHYNSDMELIEKYDTEEHHQSGVYTAQMAKDDRRNLTIQTGVRYVKLYAPAAVLGAASIVCILAANGLMRKRVAALTAAYTAVDEAFKKYRQNVKLELGAEADRRFRFGEILEDMKQKEKDVEDGKDEETSEDSKYLQTGRYKKGNMYARYFDETSKYWRRVTSPADIEANKFFILSQEKQANRLLHSRGYLFLNEVYNLLGFDPTDEGMVVGWVLNGDGDGYVDFGLFDSNDDAKREFINNSERCVLIDPNVDGVIYGKLAQLDL